MASTESRVKEVAYGAVAGFVYWWRVGFLASRAPKVMTIGQTLDHVLHTECSVVRFGDGELAIWGGKSISYQSYSPELADALRDALITVRPDVLACIPGVFDGMKCIEPNSRRWWIKQLLRGHSAWTKLTGTKRLFGNAFLSRPYFMHQHHDRSRIEALFANIKQLWADRDVTIVEGMDTRFGVGNSLLDNATSVCRILCPAANAFEALDPIETACLGISADSLFLVALGPAAKPLVVRLKQSGRRAVDVGHLDIEYEWFLRNAQTPTLIPGKAVNEAGAIIRDRTCTGDDLYLGQVHLIIDGNNAYAVNISDDARGKA